MDLAEAHPFTHAKARSVNSLFHSLFHPPFHIMSPSSCAVNGPNKRGATQVSIGCNPSYRHAMLYHDHFVHASNFPFLNSKKSSKHRESHWPKTPPAITIIKKSLAHPSIIYILRSREERHDLATPASLI